MPVATISLSALRVPTGRIAVTLDVAGFDPCSVVVAASDPDKLVGEMNKMVCSTIGPRHAVQTHVLVRRSVEAAFQSGDNDAKKNMMLTLLWLALNHPHHADQMRAAMSEALRRDGKAHLSVTVDAGGTWAFGLVDKFIDASPVIAALPEDTPVSLSIGKVMPTRPMQ